MVTTKVLTFSLHTPRRDTQGLQYSSTHSLSRHWMEASGQPIATATLLPGNAPRYPLNRRHSGSQNRYGRFRDEKKTPAPAAIRTPASPARILVTTRAISLHPGHYTGYETA